MVHPPPSARKEPETGVSKTNDDRERRNAGAAHQPSVSELDAPRAVIYMRGSAVGHEREAAIIGAFESLAADGVFDDVEIHTWPRKVSLEAGESVGCEYVEAFETFESWATDHGVAIRPPFVVRDQDCLITQEHDEVLVTPMRFLSVWDGTELAGVYPCSHADGFTTIEEFLASVHDDATAIDQLAARATDRSSTTGTTEQAEDRHPNRETRRMDDAANYDGEP